MESPTLVPPLADEVLTGFLDFLASIGFEEIVEKTRDKISACPRNRLDGGTDNPLKIGIPRRGTKLSEIPGCGRLLCPGCANGRRYSGVIRRIKDRLELWDWGACTQFGLPHARPYFVVNYLPPPKVWTWWHLLSLTRDRSLSREVTSLGHKVDLAEIRLRFADQATRERRCREHQSLVTRLEAAERAREHWGQAIANKWRFGHDKIPRHGPSGIYTKIWSESGWHREHEVYREAVWALGHLCAQALKETLREILGDPHAEFGISQSVHLMGEFGFYPHSHLLVSSVYHPGPNKNSLSLLPPQLLKQPSWESQERSDGWTSWPLSELEGHWRRVAWDAMGDHPPSIPPLVLPHPQWALAVRDGKSGRIRPLPKMFRQVAPEDMPFGVSELLIGDTGLAHSVCRSDPPSLAELTRYTHLQVIDVKDRRDLHGVINYIFAAPLAQLYALYAEDPRRANTEKFRWDTKQVLRFVTLCQPQPPLASHWGLWANGHIGRSMSKLLNYGRVTRERYGGDWREILSVVKRLDAWKDAQGRHRLKTLARQYADQEDPKRSAEIWGEIISIALAFNRGKKPPPRGGGRQ